MNRTMILFAAIPVFLILSPAAAVVLHVPSEFETIQGAVDASADGDTVELADGNYRGDGNRDVNLQGKLITVRSASGYPDHCTVFPEGYLEVTHRGFVIPEGPAPGPVLEGITIAQTFYPGLGGGIYCEGSCTIIRCAFSQCEAFIGGGLYVGHGPVTVSDCTFASGWADRGAGIYVADSQADPGVTLIRCTLDSNLGLSDGGGIQCQRGNCSLDGCTIYDTYSGTGAIHAGPFSNLNIRNTIVAFGNHGAAVYREDFSPIELACSDLYGNAAGDWTGSISDQLGTRGNISLDPLFCDAGHDDFGLQAASPCSENNNPVCGQIGAWGVGCGPDLTVLRIDPDWAPAGAPVPVRIVLANVGTKQAASSTTTLRIDGMDACGAVATPTVSPGTTRVVNCELPGEPPGVRELEGCADALGQVGESNEANNCRTEDLHLLTPESAESPARPRVDRIATVVPNPAAGAAAIQCVIGRAGPVRVELIDVAGRRVRTIDAGILPAGSHAIRWDGAGDNGVGLPAGVYQIRLQSSGSDPAGRLIVVR